MRKSSSMLVAIAGLAALGIPVATSINTAPVEGRSARSVEQAASKSATTRTVEVSSAIERAVFGGYYSRAGRRTYPGRGWPVAHDRRMARKRRNQSRNRAAHRR